MCARLIDWHTSQRHSKPSQHLHAGGWPVLGALGSLSGVLSSPLTFLSLSLTHSFSTLNEVSTASTPLWNLELRSMVHPPPGLLSTPTSTVPHCAPRPSQTVLETGQPHFCSCRPSAPLPEPAHPWKSWKSCPSRGCHWHFFIRMSILQFAPPKMTIHSHWAVVSIHASGSSSRCARADANSRTPEI